MAVPQRARLWLGAFAFSAALALSSSYAIHSATARNVKRTSSTDLTPTLAEQRSPPPETVVAAVLDAGRSTGIDPALLLTIAATESRFQANAKNRTSSATGLLQFTKQTWLENLKKFGGKHGLSHLAALIHRSGVGYLVARAPARNRISALRNDPRIATLLAAERLDYQKEQSKDRHLQVVDFYLIHALGVSGANRFIEAVSNRPSVPCKAVVGDVAWKGSGLFRDLPHGAATSLGVAYDAISVRFEQSRSYYASLLEHDATAAYPKPEPEEAGYWAAPR
ncbi:MAG: transglycosylase SLT domain-containing protein [Acetobacteraceae bacterium]|jgi:transglycosylase-like protein with SLT domain